MPRSMSKKAKRSFIFDDNLGSSSRKRPKTYEYFDESEDNDSLRKAWALLKAGHHGFLVTYKLSEEECIQDSIQLLNDYADEMYGKISSDSADNIPVNKRTGAGEQARFEFVNTELVNCLFIKTVLPDPKELALKIMYDAAQKKKVPSRHIVQLLPIEVVTNADLPSIIKAARKLFDKYFLIPKTFAIMFNNRFDNNLEKRQVVLKLTKLVRAKNKHNKLNREHPELMVVVEALNGLCLLGVLPQFYDFKRYNLMETYNKTSGGIQSLAHSQTVEPASGDCQEQSSDAVDTHATG